MTLPRTRNSKAVTRTVPTEAEVQRGCVALLRGCGAQVWETSQGYRKDPGGTRMTPGLSDIVAFFPRGSRTLFFEVKRPGGKRTPAQEAFALAVCLTRSDYGWGGVEELKALMTEWGLLK